MSKKRLLIADSSERFHAMISEGDHAKNYDIHFVKTGPEVLQEVEKFKPDLIVLDLLLPKMHAIEIMNSLEKTTPILVTSFEVMVQNYHAALDHGAIDYIIKPFSADYFFEKISDYFKGSHTPSKFEPRHSIPTESGNVYNPTPLFSSSYMKFWGTRGSTPVSGPEFMRYGGNTSCLEVTDGSDLVIIDAGSGIRPLGDYLDLSKHQELNIFISHTHLDHVSSFPFFDPLYREGITINIYTPVSFEKTTKELFTELLAYSFFPIRLDEMRATVNFLDLREGDRVSVGDIHVDCCYTYHPGPTLGFKITTPHAKIGYVTDNEMFIGYHDKPTNLSLDDALLEPHLELIEFLQGCDIIVHEAQYFPREYEQKIGWGHSSISNASALFRFVDCDRWFVTHHDPKHTDITLQIKFELHRQILQENGIELELRAARDGLIVPFQ
ncbi:MAG: response regulator [Simkaniaceae bacterium]|nr:response regulator [Simkaniaceae bacterium]